MNSISAPQHHPPHLWRSKEERFNVAAHAGRLRATVKTLASDLDYVLEDLPVELHERVRAIFAHDIRRAKQVLEEIRQ